MLHGSTGRYMVLHGLTVVQGVTWCFKCYTELQGVT